MMYDELLEPLIDQTIDQLLVQAGCGEPPVDALSVARVLGMQVVMDTSLTARARCVRLASLTCEAGNRPTIVLRPEPRQERRQWAVAHEIGEQLSGQIVARAGLDPAELPPGFREQLANHFAGRLLLPKGWFGRDGQALDWDLPALKQRYPTASHELITRRSLEVGQTALVTICDQGRITFRRSSHASRPPQLTPGEEACWQTAQRQGVACELLAAELRIRAWPIHEDAWHREILRTEWTGAID